MSSPGWGQEGQGQDCPRSEVRHNPASTLILRYGSGRWPVCRLRETFGDWLFAVFFFSFRAQMPQRIPILSEDFRTDGLNQKL
eukprot:scaffold12556_cov47-Phaeocystis_antarctica.AAC.1